MATGRKLAVPRAGAGILKLESGKQLSQERGVICAGWQTEEQNADGAQPIPKRVVIRCDGTLKDQRGPTQAAGWPCGVLEIRYAIGGIEKSVLVDAVSQQSALTVWATSVDVTPVWDQRRIDRLAALNAEPCRSQLLGAAINSSQGAGDMGPADARWLDVINVDDDDETTEFSIHPIPDGARGLRFLDTLVSGVMTSVPALTTMIAWSADTFDNFPNGCVQFNTNGATDTSILIAPPLARYLFLGFPSTTISTFDIPSFIEWIMAPATLPGY
jgi:hypothetical protein